MGSHLGEARALTVVDTAFLIALTGKSQAALRASRRLAREGGMVRIPAAVWTEYLAGFPPGRREAEARDLLDAAEFHPFLREEADEAAALQHQLLLQGRRLSWSDLQVAATALVTGEPLVSNDLAFGRVPGLRVIRY